jgi:hypothetical protein
MRIFFGAVLAMIMMSGGVLRAAGTGDSFLTVGATYYLGTFKDAPIPFQNTGEASTATVKIVQYGNAQWYWVEFDEYHFPSKDKTGYVTIFKNRTWVNFAQVTTVSLGAETDYTRTYPQGFKIVPYQGP